MVDEKELLSRFELLKEIVKNEPLATTERIEEIEKEWQFLYDAACDEYDDENENLTDDKYYEICNFHYDHIASMINW